MKFRNSLAVVLITGTFVLWIVQGLGAISISGEILGALIATWTLVVQFYFRKKES